LVGTHADWGILDSGQEAVNRLAAIFNLLQIANETPSQHSRTASAVYG
jgi:hypothetical protein